MNHGANMDVRDSTAGWGVVHCAAKGADEKMLRALVRLGANVDMVDKEEFTALMHMVVEDQNWTIAKLLVDLGADVNRQVLFKTTLHWAASQNKEEAARRLLEMGANVEARDDLGQTPMIRAAQVGASGVMRALAKGGANVNATTPNGVAAIHQVRTRDGVRTLLELGADVNTRDKVTGNTPLHEAVDKQRSEEMEELLKVAEAGARNFAGKTPLDVAHQMGDQKIISLLQGGPSFSSFLFPSALPPFVLHVSPLFLY